MCVLMDGTGTEQVLNDVTAATQPLRSFMPETAETRPVRLRRQAAQLPQPLYTLYGQLSGFNDAFDAGFDFSIVDATKEKSDHSLGLVTSFGHTPEPCAFFCTSCLLLSLK